MGHLTRIQAIASSAVFITRLFVYHREIAGEPIPDLSSATAQE
jgi:hypothetical protein